MHFAVRILAMAVFAWLSLASARRLGAEDATTDAVVPDLAVLMTSQCEALSKAGTVECTYSAPPRHPGEVPFQTVTMLAPNGDFLYHQRFPVTGESAKRAGGPYVERIGAVVDGVQYLIEPSPVTGRTITSSAATPNRKVGRTFLVPANSEIDFSVPGSPLALCFEAFALHDRLVGGNPSATPRWCDCQDHGLLVTTLLWFSTADVVAGERASLVFTADALRRFRNKDYRFDFVRVANAAGSLWRLKSSRKSMYWNFPEAQVTFTKAQMVAMNLYRQVDFTYTDDAHANPLQRIIPTTITTSFVSAGKTCIDETENLTELKTCKPDAVATTVQDLVKASPETIDRDLVKDATSATVADPSF